LPKYQTDFQFHVRAGFDQCLNESKIVIVRGKHDCRRSIWPGRVRIGPFGEQSQRCRRSPDSAASSNVGFAGVAIEIAAIKTAITTAATDILLTLLPAVPAIRAF
jgi:hypothetical protein